MLVKDKGTIEHMSLRDVFAMHIVGGLSADPDANWSDEKQAAQWAYKMANAMLEVRDESREK